LGSEENCRLGVPDPEYLAASAIDGAKAAAKHKTQTRFDKPVIRLFLFLFP